MPPSNPFGTTRCTTGITNDTSKRRHPSFAIHHRLSSPQPLNGLPAKPAHLTPTEKYNLALACSTEGKPIESLRTAVELLKELLDFEPGNEKTQHLLAECYRKMGEHELRLEALLKAHHALPNTWMKIQIACCLFDLGRYEAGLEWVEKEDLDPKTFSHSGLYIRSRLYRKLGMVHKAEADLRALEEFEAGMPSVWDEMD